MAVIQKHVKNVKQNMNYQRIILVLSVTRLVPDVMKQDVVIKQQLVNGILQQKLVSLNVEQIVNVQNVQLLQVQYHVQNVTMVLE